MRGAKPFLLAEAPVSHGSAAYAADQNGIGGGVVADRAVMVVREDRIIFPAQAVVDGQVAGHLPLIARV